jgi:hypothetical protein
MTCADVQRVLPEFVDGAPDGAFPTEFESHLKSCPACSDLVSDLTLIASAAGQLAATEEPAPRVWAQIAAQLRAEGVMRDPEAVPARPILLPAYPRRRWNAWWLAPIAAALLAAGAYLVSHKPPTPMAQQQAPAPPVSSPTPTPPAVAQTLVDAPAPAPTEAPDSLATKPAKSSDVLASVATHDVEPAPSEDDQRFLSAVSTRAPSMRATYEGQLRGVNANIREVQDYLQRYPGDADARQQLMDAYQQKALLYQIALDRIQ